MKKGNKKLLVIAVLLLLITVSLGTYAIYRSTASGTASLDTAAWTVKVNGTDMETGSFTFDTSKINWTKTQSPVNGKIAPGATGTIKIIIDATGSEVDVDYTATMGTIKVGNNNNTNNAFTVTPAVAADMSGTISYSASSMTKEITLNVTWAGADSDNTTKDAADKAMNGSTITVPFTVVTKQHLN